MNDNSLDDAKNSSENLNTYQVENHTTESAFEENYSTSEGNPPREKQFAAYGEESGSSSYKANGALWVRYWYMDSVNFQELKVSGINDVFIDGEALSNPQYNTSLQNFLRRAKEAQVRVSAWVVCFNNNGSWVDPTGKYSYQVNTTYQEAVKVAYQEKVQVAVKVPYTRTVKQYYKYYYKSGGVWRYVWRYRWVTQTYYKTVYQYQYVTKYRTEYVNKTRTETRVGYNTTFAQNYQNQLITKIQNYTKIPGINGIHLDYLRYPGNAYNSTNGTQTITSFVAKVQSAVKTINPQALLSAALMPECASNAYYYGQDYPKLANYLDVLIPMIYKGNYQKDSTWIASVTNYIARNSGTKPVWAGILGYQSDNNITVLPAAELQEDVQSALDNGAQGYAIFRYGLFDTLFLQNSANLNYTPVNESKPVSGGGNSSIFSLEIVKDAAKKVKTFLDTNQRLPNYVTINQEQVSMSQFLQLLLKGVLQINAGVQTNLSLENVRNPPNFEGDALKGNLTQTEYLDLALKIRDYIKNNAQAPNFISSSAGRINFQALVGIFTRILAFHADNGRLPNYVGLDAIQVLLPPSWSGNTAPYLQETLNCQVNDPAIRALADSLTSNLTSAWAKAEAIFRWVRDNISYSFYYNTLKGANGTLSSSSGNCVDQSHLLVALSRATGLVTRYAHGSCTFTSGNVYGHVWGEILIDGRWVKADTTSSLNSLGVINNWNIFTVTMKGIYAELPF